MQTVSKKAEILEEISSIKQNLKKQNFISDCPNHLGKQQQYICKFESSVLCSFCIIDHCIDSFCRIILIKTLEANFQQELSSLCNFLSTQNPVRIARIDSILINLKSFLCELTKKLKRKKTLQCEMESENLIQQKPKISRKNSFLGDNQEENNCGHYAELSYEARKRSYTVESLNNSSFENSNESENLNSNNADYFSSIKNSLKKQQAQRKQKRSLSAAKANVNFEASFSVKEFASKEYITKEFLEPIVNNSFHKNLNLKEKIKGSNSNFSKLNENLNNSNSNQSTQNEPKTKIKELLQQLDCECLKLMNNFIKENFECKIKNQISLYLDEKCESRSKEAEKFVKGKLKKFLLQREAQAKRLLNKAFKKRKKQYKRDFNDSNYSESSVPEAEGEKLNFYDLTANCNIRNCENVNLLEDQKNLISSQHQQVKKLLNEANEEKEINYLAFLQKASKEKSEKAYLKNFKQLFKEKFLTVNDEGIEYEYVIKEQEYFFGQENNFNPLKNKFQIQRENKSPPNKNNNSNIFKATNASNNAHKNSNCNAEEEIKVSYQQFLGNINFKPEKPKKESFELEPKKLNNLTKNCSENSVAKLNNSDFIFKRNNNLFFSNSSENLESLDYSEGRRMRKNTALSCNKIIKLNLSTFQNKNEFRKNLNKDFDNSYELNTEKIIEMPESNNIESNSNNNKNDTNKINEQNGNLIANFNSNLNVKPEIKITFEPKETNESACSNSISDDNSNSKKINIFDDSDSADNEDEKASLKVKENTQQASNKIIEKAENKPTDKKENKFMNNKLIENNYYNYNKNNYDDNGKACFLSKEKESHNKEVKDLFRKESTLSEQALKIENKNNFYAAKAADNHAKKINFLDFSEKNSNSYNNNINNQDKNNTEKKTKIIKSNIFNKNINENKNESFEQENSANITIDLNNPKADLNITSNYKANIEDNNLIDNTNIQEQTNIKSIIQALDSRILTSTAQAEKAENEFVKEKSNAFIASSNCRKISAENFKSNTSQIFNDTYIIHLVNEDEKSDEEQQDENVKQSSKAKESEKNLSKNSSFKINENNNHNINKSKENNILIKKPSGENDAFENKEKEKLSQKPGFNKFLLNAQKIIEEAKNKKGFIKNELCEEKQIKVTNSCIENIKSETPNRDNIDTFNYFPKKLNLENNFINANNNNNNNNFNFKSNYNVNDLELQNLNNKTNPNFGFIANTANNNSDLGNLPNILNKNPAYNNNLNNTTNLSSLVNELNNNSIIVNNSNNFNSANLENIKNALENNNNNNTNLSQNNLNMTNNPSILSEANNTQIIQLLQTLLQNQNNNNNNMNNQNLMQIQNAPNMNGFNPINPNNFFNNFSNNSYENFNPINNLLGNPMNPLFNNNINNNNLIYMMLQQMPSSPLKDFVLQSLNSRNLNPNQPPIPLHFPNNNNPLPPNLNLLLNANKNLNNFPLPNNSFNQFNGLNNPNIFNNNNNPNMHKIIEILHNQKTEPSAAATNNPLNNKINFNNISNNNNNNFAGINNQNQLNMINSKDINFPWKNSNAINNIQPQLGNNVNDRNFNNYNNYNNNNNNNQNILANLNINNCMPNSNQVNPLNSIKENKDISIKKEEEFGKSIYKVDEAVKEKETCKYAKNKFIEDSKKTNDKIKITSMLSEKKMSKYEYSYGKSSKFYEK